MLAAIGMVAACDIGDIRRPAPAPSPSPSPSLVELRHARVPVPSDFSLQVLSFSDAVHGYALYTRCGEASPGGRNCAAILLTTVDGGRRWEERRHPKPYAASQQMIVADDGSVLLLAERHGWYVSTDDARTFWPAEYTDDRRRVLPTRPPLSGEALDTADTATGGLWVVALERGRPVLAYSGDGGRTWRREDVPGPVGWLETAWFEISPDRTDLWLLGQPSPRSWPLIWRSDGVRWQEQPADSVPSQMQDSVAIGNGVLLVSWAGGGGLVDDQGYQEIAWPLAGSYLRVLTDGTLMAAGSAADGVSLGIGNGLNRRWVRITLSASGGN